LIGAAVDVGSDVETGAVSVLMREVRNKRVVGRDKVVMVAYWKIRSCKKEKFSWRVPSRNSLRVQIQGVMISELQRKSWYELGG
jgi:hypothetical protein